MFKLHLFRIARSKNNLAKHVRVCDPVVHGGDSRSFGGSVQAGWWLVDDPIQGAA
jgi:hypothetical protein